MKFFTVISLLILFNFIKCQSDKCFEFTDNPSFFATKTAYSSVSAKHIYTQPGMLLNIMVLYITIICKYYIPFLP